MWLAKITNSFLNWIFPGLITSEEEQPQDEMEEIDVEQELVKLEEEREKFKFDNVVFNKLNYLEQYIKIFSLTFSEEYNQYLTIIQNYREQYQKELEDYQNGFSGNITFSMDPEKESTIYINVINLEDEIKKFVEFEVNYKLHKDKFCELCNKLNVFYNALFSTKVGMQTISSQLNNASASLGAIIDEVKKQSFFEKDSRKREELFSYIIYSEYMMFKSFLKISIISSLEEYKQELSGHYKLFSDAEYNRLIFKFLIEDLENLQIFITDNLKSDSTYQYLIGSCQSLESRLDDYSDEISDSDFFNEIVKLENTIYNLSGANNVEFSIKLPEILKVKKSNNEIISIRQIASGILNLVDNSKAKLLQKIIAGFRIEISWREFFFLCKIFEVYKELIEVSSNTIFNMVKEKFLKIESKYNEYTDDYIRQEKQKVLAYNGSKTKKYILLITVGQNAIEDVVAVLDKLSLDIIVYNNNIYLNHMYFNGFKNLEENFGEYVTF